MEVCSGTVHFLRGKVSYKTKQRGFGFNIDILEKNLLKKFQKSIGQRGCTLSESNFRFCRFKSLKVIISEVHVGWRHLILNLAIFNYFRKLN